MPYSIQRRGNEYCLIRKEAGARGEKAGSTKSCHDSFQKAAAARALIAGTEHGWKPTGAPSKRRYTPTKIRYK